MQRSARSSNCHHVCMALHRWKPRPAASATRERHSGRGHREHSDHQRNRAAASLPCTGGQHHSESNSKSQEQLVSAVAIQPGPEWSRLNRQRGCSACASGVDCRRVEHGGGSRGEATRRHSNDVIVDAAQGRDVDRDGDCGRMPRALPHGTNVNVCAGIAGEIRTRKRGRNHLRRIHSACSVC